MILKEVKSGTIDLVMQGAIMTLQFNCDCDDALPYCNAMCCKLRMMSNVELDEEEKEKFRHVTIKQPVVMQQPERLVTIIPWNPDWSCSYLENNRCQVHGDKPRRCKEEHCSPQGNPSDSLIKRRSRGWLITPIPVGMVPIGEKI